MGFFDEYYSLEERKDVQQAQPPFVSLTGRPERDTVISQDDIVNLSIALNTTGDVKHFLKVMSK